MLWDSPFKLLNFWFKKMNVINFWLKSILQTQSQANNQSRFFWIQQFWIWPLWKAIPYDQSIDSQAQKLNPTFKDIQYSRFRSGPEIYDRNRHCRIGSNSSLLLRMNLKTGWGMKDPDPPIIFKCKILFEEKKQNWCIVLNNWEPRTII